MLNENNTALYLPPEKLSLLRQRSLDWEAHDFYRGDEELFSIFRAVNQVHDLTTVWSCAGHKQERGRIYFMFATSGTGFRRLLAMFSKFKQGLADIEHHGQQAVRAYRASLVLTSSIWPSASISPALIRPSELYPSCILEYNYDVWSERCEVLTLLVRLAELDWFSCAAEPKQVTQRSSTIHVQD